MNDTIAAISTTVGVGAISIVRMSGKSSISIVKKIFDGIDLEKVSSHTIHYGHIVYQNDVIDEVLVTIMHAPRTFTTEDVVEINCHGGVATTNKVLEVLLLSGARLAEPGEFTKRAFLNGRIDLIEAESVMNLINSKTDKARQASINQLNGVVSKKIRSIRQEILNILANIEVNIDYPEYEDIEVVTNEKLKSSTMTIKEQLEKLILDSENSQILNTGIKTAIIGRPNVGKSSLLNSLLGENKAIVTDIQGTTRDIVEGNLNLDGIQLQLLDTAGIRETSNIIEKIGVNKSISMIEEADLVILVLDNDKEITEEDLNLLDKIYSQQHIVVINKCDLNKKIDISMIKSKNIVYTSTVSEKGTEELKTKIREMFNLNELNKNDFNVLGNIRQISLAKEALKIMDDVQLGIDNNVPVDLIEIDIKRVWTKLGDIIGENYSDELINQLFSQFCLGK